MPEISILISKAELFAIRAHGEQKRKYTGEPYVNHTMAVATLVDYVTCGDQEMVAAAILHDTIEDTDVEKPELVKRFGQRVADLVEEVSDVSRLEDGNREERKAIDREFLAYVSSEAKTIKLADLIDNTKSIVPHDPGFAKVYMEEKRKLLQVLTMGDHGLWLWANALVEEYYNEKQV